LNEFYQHTPNFGIRGNFQTCPGERPEIYLELDVIPASEPESRGVALLIVIPAEAGIQRR